MKLTLVKSFILLTIFYYVGFFLWLFPWEKADSPFEAIIFSISSVGTWGAILIASPFVIWAIGYFVSYISRIIIVSARRVKATDASGGLGVRISLGELIMPGWMLKAKPKKSLKVEYPKKLEGILNGLPKVHRKLYEEVLNVLKSNKDAYVGPGHTKTLLAHSLNVLNAAANDPKKDLSKDPLAPIAVLAHDIGKILSHKKVKEDGVTVWVPTGKRQHDTLSGYIVATLPSFQLLPALEGRCLLLALKYNHKPGVTPKIRGMDEANKRVMGLIEIMKVADKRATATEKTEVTQKIDKDKLFTDYFVKSVQKVNFHNPKSKQGPYHGWRNGNHVFISEKAIRKAILDELPEDWQSAFNLGRRVSGEVTDFTAHLIDWLKKKKWLQTNFDGMDSPQGLWEIQAGTLITSGIFYVVVPEIVSYDLPESATYPIKIIKPILTRRDKKARPQKTPPQRVTAKDAEALRKKKEVESQKADAPTQKDDPKPQAERREEVQLKNEAAKKKPPEKEGSKNHSPEKKERQRNIAPSERKSSPSAEKPELKEAKSESNNTKEAPKRKALERNTYYTNSESVMQTKLIDALNRPRFYHHQSELDAAEASLKTKLSPYVYSRAWVEKINEAFELEVQNPYFLSIGNLEERRPVKKSNPKKKKGIMVAQMGAVLRR